MSGVCKHFSVTESRDLVNSTIKLTCTICKNVLVLTDGDIMTICDPLISSIKSPRDVFKRIWKK